MNTTQQKTLERIINRMSTGMISDSFLKESVVYDEPDGAVVRITVEWGSGIRAGAVYVEKTMFIGARGGVQLLHVYRMGCSFSPKAIKGEIESVDY
jgi:hypothetical protein